MNTPMILNDPLDPTDLVSDKRRGRRQPLLEAPATLFDESAPFLSPGYGVRVHDISLAGIGFLVDKPLPIGSTHRIHLETREIRIISRVSVNRSHPTQRLDEHEQKVLPKLRLRRELR